MPPKKKKTPITAYSIFVRETREEYQRKGWYFPRKNDEAFPFVSPLWKKLSEEDRQKYNTMAKNEKHQGASDLEKKFNSLGTSFAEVEAEVRERDEFKNIMMNTIKNIVDQSDFNTSFKTQTFHICHVNFFYINGNGTFKPAEIALCEFNLKKGVLSRYHAFINPGPIETGYRFEALKKLEDTHRIPIEDPTWTLGERDYSKLFNEIRNFLCKKSSSGRCPPIYTMNDDEKNNFSISAVRSTLETLCDAANEDYSEFRVYDLPLLYHHLRQKAVTESPVSPDSDARYFSVSLALSDLERDRFCYTKGISCEFHEKKDIVLFCSLSTVTRLVYTMCDYLLNYLDEELVYGGHAPKDSISINEAYKSKNYSDFETIPPLRKPKLESQTNTNVIDEDGFEYVSNTKKHMKPQGNIMSYSSAVRPSTSSVSNPLQQSCDFRPIAPALQKPMQAPGSSFLKFQTPRSLLSEDEDDEEFSSLTNEDSDSTLTTPNLSQATVISGYSASASLSQSSYATDVSSSALSYLGRGRGLPRTQMSSVNMNWALNAGRGSRPKPQ